MGGEINWREEIIEFDIDSAAEEARITWLKLGRCLSSIAGSAPDWIATGKDADHAMSMAARAEACFWHAAGDAEAIDLDAFIPELRKEPTP